MNFLKDIEKYDYIINILLLGKNSIGKSIFFQRLILDNYKSFKKLCNNYIPTIVIDFNIIIIKFNDKIFKIQIWDTSGLECYSAITEAYYKGKDIILIFYDAFDKESFEKVKMYYEETFKLNNKKIYFLIRNKYDLSSNSEK